MITFKNRVAAGTGIGLGEIITANLVMDIIVVPVALIGYFLMKLILKAVGAKEFLEGQNNLRNTVIVWFVIFIFVLLMPLFKK